MRARGTRVDSQGNEKGQLSNVKESIEGEGGHNRNGCFRQGVEAHTNASPGPRPETLRGQLTPPRATEIDMGTTGDQTRLKSRILSCTETGRDCRPLLLIPRSQVRILYGPTIKPR